MKSNNAITKSISEVYYGKSKNCEKSRKNQSNSMQRNRAINETFAKRNDFIRENIERDVAQNPNLDFIALYFSDVTVKNQSETYHDQINGIYSPNLPLSWALCRKMAMSGIWLVSGCFISDGKHAISFTFFSLSLAQ